MPDNEDYAELGRLLSDPRAWTGAEAATMRSLLREQTALSPDGTAHIVWESCLRTDVEARRVDAGWHLVGIPDHTSQLTLTDLWTRQAMF